MTSNTPEGAPSVIPNQVQSRDVATKPNASGVATHSARKRELRRSRGGGN